MEKIMKRKTPDVPLTADDPRRPVVLEKLVMFGSGAGAAAIYGTVH
jgi:hypothetical protein